MLDFCSAYDAFVKKKGEKRAAKKKADALAAAELAGAGNQAELAKAKAVAAEEQLSAAKVERKAARKAAEKIVTKADLENPNFGRSSTFHRAAKLVETAAELGLVAPPGPNERIIVRPLPRKKPKPPVKWLPGDRSDSGVLLGPLLKDANMALPPALYKPHANLMRSQKNSIFSTRDAGEFFSYDKGSKEFDILNNLNHTTHKKPSMKIGKAEDFLHALDVEYANDPEAAQTAKNNFFEKHPESQFNAKLVVSEEISKMSDSEGEETTETERAAASVHKVEQDKIDDDKLAAMKSEDSKKTMTAVEMDNLTDNLSDPELAKMLDPDFQEKSAALKASMVAVRKDDETIAAMRHESDALGDAPSIPPAEAPAEVLLATERAAASLQKDGGTLAATEHEGSTFSDAPVEVDATANAREVQEDKPAAEFVVTGVKPAA